MICLDAFRPFERLIEISLLGRTVLVPENNVLLRCFQYVVPDLPYGPWCWNGDCESDRISYRVSGDPVLRTGLSCQIQVSEGLEIVEISPSLQRYLLPVLAQTRSAEPVAS